MTDSELSTPTPNPTAIRRRAALKALAGLGVGTAAFQRAVAARAAQEGGVTAEMIAQAEWIAGLELSDEEREDAARTVRRSLRQFEALRKVEIGPFVPPALGFLPEPLSMVQRLDPNDRPGRAEPIEWHAPMRPESDEDLAFLPVAELAALVRSRRVTSRELTELSLTRLKKYDPMLKCVVNLTEDLAREQADRADREIAAGRYRGPLHGLPWGAKDLIAVPGYPTTWGAPQYKDRQFDEKATVVERLEAAGAVLVAKLSLGALAMGDRWFGGMTRTPWDPRRGSSGSSAGSASASSAGLVAFAIGSETLGSIVSPSRACGATGLRPSFGGVSRAGCMTLSWSMDKLGPIARSAECCALVFDAIRGSDPRDPTSIDRPFAWPPRREVRGLRVGYLKRGDDDASRPDLDVLRTLGVELVAIELPDGLPTQAITLMLGTEAACAFDQVTREHITEGLNSWPSTFRNGQFVPAVEYLRAARARTLLMRAMADLMATVDLYLGDAEDLSITNLTGHPEISLPFGTRGSGNSRPPADGDDDDQPATEPARAPRPRPGSITLTGRLHDESTLLAVAHAFQTADGRQLERPPLDRFLAEDNEPDEDDD